MYVLSVDNRNAFDSRDPAYMETIVEGRSLVSFMRREVKAISFMWIPSHLGLMNVWTN